MTNPLDPTPPPIPTQTPAPTSTPAWAATSGAAPPIPPAAVPRAAAPERGRRERHAGHIIAIVAGCLLLLPGLALAVAGGGAAIGQAVATDDDGYFRLTLDTVESDGVAISTADSWLDGDAEGDGSPWVFDWLDLDVRLRAEGAAATDEVFVGIARTDDVEQYLGATAHSEIVELNDRTARYEQVSGVRSITPPAEQDFWVVSAVGAGEQQLDWNARGGAWTVVVMNADGSPDVAADVELGARSDAVTPIAISLIVFGGAVVLLAGGLILVGARGRRARDGGLGVGRPGSGTPSARPVVRLDDDERRPTPVG